MGVSNQVHIPPNVREIAFNELSWMLRVFRYFIFTKNPFKKVFSLSRTLTHTDSLTPLFALAVKRYQQPLFVKSTTPRSIEVNDAKDAL